MVRTGHAMACSMPCVRGLQWEEASSQPLEKIGQKAAIIGQRQWRQVLTVVSKDTTTYCTEISSGLNAEEELTKESSGQGVLRTYTYGQWRSLGPTVPLGLVGRQPAMSHIAVQSPMCFPVPDQNPLPPLHGQFLIGQWSWQPTADGPPQDRNPEGVPSTERGGGANTSCPQPKRQHPRAHV